MEGCCGKWIGVDMSTTDGFLVRGEGAGRSVVAGTGFVVDDPGTFVDDLRAASGVGMKVLSWREDGKASGDIAC